MISKLKTCGKCHDSKSVTEFPKSTSASDGYGSWCKACCKTANEQRRKKLMIQNQDPPTEHPNQLRCCSHCHRSFPLTFDNFHRNRARKDGWNRKCKPCQREQNRSASRQFNKNHPEKRKKFSQRYRQENLESIREYHKNWRSEHIEKHTFCGKRTKAKQRNYAWEIDFDTYISRFWNKKCVYCGNPNNGGIDRVDNGIGYTLNNCVPCCRWCNLIKFNRSVEQMNEHLIRILKHQEII